MLKGEEKEMERRLERGDGEGDSAFLITQERAGKEGRGEAEKKYSSLPPSFLVDEDVKEKVGGGG